MTEQNSLEISGTIREYPLGELIVEIGQSGLSGSLRVANGPQRTILYFRDGAPVYAVSNSRRHRLIATLLERKMIDPKRIAGVDPVNDVELAAFLRREALATDQQLNSAITSQIEGITIDALSWAAAEWQFSALARVRDDLHQRIDLDRVLLNYARCLPYSIISERFRSVEEAFSLKTFKLESLTLLPHEAHLVSRFGDLTLTVADIRNSFAVPEEALLQALYVLWLGGALIRHDWNAAFSPARVAEMRNARLLKTSAAAPIARKPQPPQAVTPAAPEITLTLDEYLGRAESAATHYDVLGVDPAASVQAVKQAYFALAKRFHPDRYHKEAPETMRRVQSAFTRLSYAHETLKTREGREGYDLKLRRETELREKRLAAGQTAEGDVQSESAFDSFEHGKAAMKSGDVGEAANHFARAVHYAPENALFKAHYGMALAADGRQRHKAETELQNAVRLEPQNAEIRIMLAEFYLGYNMAKRAEGELRRFLELVPAHRDATAMLRKIEGR